MRPVRRLVDTALGQDKADLVLKNVQVFNVFTGRFSTGDIAVINGYVAGMGEYSGHKELNLAGKYLTPGFIDAHVHMESSMVSPAQFARAVVPAGTTTVFADPHEIANVLGVKGLRYMLQATGELPLNVFFMLPSCVPATDLEHSGARLDAGDLAELMQHPRVLGLGEMMNYPGVLLKADNVLDKIRLAHGKKVDGHAPGLTGKELTAYIAAGIHSDHECVTPEEAAERLAQGMYVMLREGSAAKNLRDLLPAVTAHTLPQCMLATDDRHPEDLIELGHINHMVKLAVAAGTDVAWVLKMATINAARYFGVNDLGAVAPGYRADMLVFDNLEDWRPAMVFKDGNLVATDGKALFRNSLSGDMSVQNTMCLESVSKEKLRVPALNSTARVIELIPGQLVTKLQVLPVPILNGEFVADPDNDILKLAVWERHHGTGNVGVGLLKGLGLKSGAIASTIAHDAHNLVVAGTNDDDMLLAVRELARIQGGIIITRQKKVLGAMPLPLAGLMTDKDIDRVHQELVLLQDIARSLGIKAGCDPFMTLAFLSLPVIPAVKLTDAGLVDVIQFKLIPVSV
jgi:adenine deaminase